MEALLAFGDAKILSIILSVVATFVISFIWYSPAVFGKKWMEYTKVKGGDTKGMGKLMGQELIATLLKVLCISVLVAALKITDFGTAIVFALILGFASSFSLALSNKIWEGRPWGLAFINMSRIFVETLVILAILMYVPY